MLKPRRSLAAEPVLADRTNAMNRGWVRQGVLWLLLLGLTVLAASLLAGSAWMSPGTVWGSVWGQGDPLDVYIVRAVRLPAVAVAALTGALLGAGGAAMQGLLRNPLADPYLLGVSGGAGLGAALWLWFAPHAPAWLPLAATGGAGVAVAGLWYFAARMRGPGSTADPVYALLLTGVVVNAMAAAIMLLLVSMMRPEVAATLMRWLTGAIEPGRWSWKMLAVMASIGGAAAAMLVRDSRGLTVLAVGERQAQALGVSVDALRRRVFVGISVVVGVSVACAGLVGFVGLVVPHLVRLVVGADHRRVVPASLVVGAAFLALADALARTTFVWLGTSVPVGAVTALVGAPLFLVLLARALGAQGRT